MKSYNYNFIFFLISILSFQGCGKNDDFPAIEDVIDLKITNFETSYNEVKISWDLDRFNDKVIIENVFILRYSDDTDSNTFGPNEIAVLPSNQTSYIDRNVPYLSDVTYSIRIDYFVDYENGVEYASIESDKKSFERDIIKFSSIPRHVITDNSNPDSYHIMIIDQNLALYNYNTKTLKIDANKSFSGGYDFYDKIVVNQNNIFLGKRNGVIYELSPNDYTEKRMFSLPIDNELRYFGFREEEIFFSDDERLKYFNTMTNDFGYVIEDLSLSYAYSINLGNNRMFMIWYQYPNFGGRIFDVSNYDQLEMIHRTDFPIDFGSRLDKGILHFNEDNSEFVSTNLGRVISIDDLSLKVELKNITGKNYLYFNYKRGKLYGAVQGERKIHVFDDETYELLDTIETKLFPIFPLVSSDGKIQVIGSYRQIYYSDYIDGFQYSGNFAIESM
ncbi:hypothetical protein [Leeuwenhoekiella sp. NPDC079379]|uniref:hypothetical protein n=1 Tax=Leeuwenhoekiella sp. NPDC079379 TaxID=3364122 RepID=UPI0037CC5FF9